MTEAARYDPVADWYVTKTANWDPEPLALLPENIAGQRVLDLACGAGRISRWLAGRGAHVTGVDLSAGLLAHAQEVESAQPLGIDYLQGSATDTKWWDGVPYEGVLCHMALMDIDDVSAAFEAAATVVAPGGWFSFSILHPCFPGGDDSAWSGLSSWPPEHGYTREGWWNTNGDGIRGQVGSNHRMLATYLNAMLGAGFVPEEFAERGATLPAILITRCRRPS